MSIRGKLAGVPHLEVAHRRLYTEIVPRTRHLFLCFAVLMAGTMWAQKQEPAPQEPPEEDESLTVPEYSFNPLQAEKELKVGEFYWKKGNARAAAQRFLEATKWNPGFADAFLRLAEAREKLKDRKAAREAYRKFLDLAPDDKRAESVRKKLGRKP
jgi:tetratricopeptide (TPR) repeat protein